MELGKGFSNLESMSKGSLLSLDRQEAKKVLEIYVKRSLSSCEAKTRGYEVTANVGNRRTGKKLTKLQRSASDFSRYTGRRQAGTVQDKNRQCARTHVDTEKSDVVSDQKNLLEKDVPEDVPTSDANKPMRRTQNGRAQQSWFKNIVNFFTRRKDEENKDNSKGSTKEPKGDNVSGCMSYAPLTGSSVDMYTPCPGLVKSKKKTSLKKAFSFKKHTTEEENKICPMDPGVKSERPNHLPLRHVFTPQTAGAGGKELYYNRVSVEIEQIVKKKELQEDRGRKPSYEGELGCEDKEVLIRKIASILQKKGDEWDKKIKEDPKLNTFFKDISYTSFKKLADIYVDKEVKTKVADVTPEEVKFAFTVHLTAKVAGLSNHPVSRIMGFGNQYLQDTFAQLSYGKKGWLDTNKDENELCQSPD